MRSEYHSARILIGDDEPIRSVATLIDDRLDRLRFLSEEDRRTLGLLGELCATVRYEDLVRWPAEVLARVCDALHINFHQNMLDQTNNETLLGSEYRHGRFLHEKTTEIPSLPDAVLNVIEPDLRRLGYLQGHDYER